MTVSRQRHTLADRFLNDAFPLASVNRFQKYLLLDLCISCKQFTMQMMFIHILLSTSESR